MLEAPARIEVTPVKREHDDQVVAYHLLVNGVVRGVFRKSIAGGYYLTDTADREVRVHAPVRVETTKAMVRRARLLIESGELPDGVVVMPFNQRDAQRVRDHAQMLLDALKFLLANPLGSPQRGEALECAERVVAKAEGRYQP